MEALLHHTSGLELIGKYLVMSNSNIQRFIFTEKNRQAARRTRVYDQNGTTFYFLNSTFAPTEIRVLGCIIFPKCLLDLNNYN